MQSTNGPGGRGSGGKDPQPPGHDGPQPDPPHEPREPRRPQPAPPDPAEPRRDRAPSVGPTVPIKPRRPAPDIYPPPPPAPHGKGHAAPRHPPAPRPPTPRPAAPRPPRPNNPRYYPGPPHHQPNPHYTPPPPSHPSSATSILWALAPLFTCGFATPFTIGYGAARLKSRALATAAVIYGLGMLVFWFGAALDEGALAPLMLLGYMGNWVGGTVHSFIIRRKVFGLPGAEPPMSANERAIALAQHRRNLRQQARELAKNDPLLAKELRIGRPDLPREYDDGGLVDVNHAPVEVIATVPGMTLELAQKVVDMRDDVGAFVSAEEVSATVGLPPQITADLAEYTIYLS